eukprot:g2553.t1
MINIKQCCLSFIVLCTLLLCVSGVLFEPRYCASQCRNSANFISRLPVDSGPTNGDNRAYAWAVLALIQVKLNFNIISPPAASRITAIVGTCLYEGAAITERSYASSVGNRFKYSGSVSPEIKNAAIDGAGYWALQRLFSDTGSFSRVFSQYERFAGTSLTSLISDTGSTANSPTFSSSSSRFSTRSPTFSSSSSRFSTRSPTFSSSSSRFSTRSSGFSTRSSGFSTRSSRFSPRSSRFSSRSSRFSPRSSPFTRFRTSRRATSSSTNRATSSSQAAFREGIAACERVLHHYTSDGFTPRGNVRGGQNGSSYRPKNAPQARAGITNCRTEMRDRSLWQPLCVPRRTEGFGTTDCTVERFLYPWAGRYTTYALQRGNEYSGRQLIHPPPRAGSAQFRREWEEVLAISARLGDREKIIAEYWADGPSTTQPAGHLWQIAADAALYERLSPAETARLLFIVGNALNDAGIASWRTKVTYDFVRPLQMIQCGEYSGRFGRAWLGPYRGVGITRISEWRPYQSPTFVSPAFAGYTSGHSTFSAAGAQALRLFFGNDRYRGPSCDRIRQGQSTFEPRSNARPGLTNVPNRGPGTPGYSPAEDVVLCWSTFTDATLQSGRSRLYGGIHVRADDDAGQALGRRVGQDVFQKANRLRFSRQITG